MMALRRGALLALAVVAATTTPAFARPDAPVVAQSLGHPSVVDFGNQVVGTKSATQDVAFTNSGSEAVTAQGASLDSRADFAIENDGCKGTVVDPGSSCTVTVSFTPSAKGLRTTKLHVADSQEDDNAVDLDGTGTVHLSRQPGSLAFGNQPVGTTSDEQTVTVTNDSPSGSSGTVSNLSIQIDGDYAETDTCGSSLPAGQFCTIHVTFTPASEGSRPGTLTITSDSTSSPDTIPLSGNGSVHLARSTSSLSFGSQTINSSTAEQTVTFTNDSAQGRVNFGTPTIQGPNASQFAITSNTCPSSSPFLGPGASCAISVRFSPTVAGASTASLRVPSSSTTSPDVIALDGTGTNPAASTADSGAPPRAAVAYEPATLDYGTRIVAGGARVLTVTLRSTGSLALSINGISIGGHDAPDFAVSSSTCTSTPLAVGASCTIDVAFKPSGPGVRTATVAIDDNAPGAPQSVGLIGRGLQPPRIYANANVEPASGAVLVALATSSRASARARGITGRRFVALSEARQVPPGSLFDARNGVLRVATATLSGTSTQVATFSGGYLEVFQRRSQNSLTDAKLVGGTFGSCKKGSKKTIRRLRANAKGRYRTTGRLASVTTRDGAWTISDRCDGTLVRVDRGTVIALKGRSKTKVTVKAGKSLLVRSD